MMRRNASKARLVLIELIIMIVFLSLAGAICMSLFSKAHILSDRSGDLSRGTLLVQETAEWLKALDGDLDALKTQLGGTMVDGDLILYVDKDFNEVAASDRTYQLIVKPLEMVNGVGRAEVRLVKGNDELQRVMVSHYAGNGMGDTP
ncbi:hypothetical protein LJC20_01725 [Eubacteriales bacterium OttesenSCG-928-M02]|nr:hypothetical protein [Eubacteriales bacterium OttesenSCG-928-M02]